MKLLRLLESSLLANEFTRVQADIDSLDPSPATIAVIAANGGEGTTTVAARLAIALADARASSTGPQLKGRFTASRRAMLSLDTKPACSLVAESDPTGEASEVLPPQGRSVLLAEGDLRAPVLATSLGLVDGPGLVHWNGESPLPIQPMPGRPDVHVLPAGRVDGVIGWSRPADLLTAAARRARQEYACVVWDAPAPSRNGDGLALASECDGVLVVVEMDQTRVDALRFLREALERSHTRILGSVLNRSGRYWPRAAAAPPRSMHVSPW